MQERRRAGLVKGVARRGAIVALGVALLAPIGARAEADPYIVCLHFPLTLPIPHHPDRFGQFYFDAVNAEQGGVDGHPVQFLTVNDGYNPAGARDAVENCRREGAQLYLGYVGIDQMVSVANWAEGEQVPYLHGSMAATNTADMTWTTFIGPTDEEQMVGLARLIGESNDPPPPVVGMIALDSPYYDAGKETFAEEIERLGIPFPVSVAVQKDESNFQSIWLDLQRQGVTVVNAYVTPSIMITMLNQRPPTYSPTFVSPSSSMMGMNIAAQGGGGGNVPLFTYHDPSPVYDADDESLPWRAEIEEFHRIFDTYSDEHRPPRDDFDWMFYLRAKQIHRLLDSLDGDASPENIRARFSTFAEDPHEAYPTCALDFTETPRYGSHAWHLFRADEEHLLRANEDRWRQAAFCTTAAPSIDLTPPVIACDTERAVVLESWDCWIRDAGIGVGSWSVVASGTPESETRLDGHGACEAYQRLEIELPPGIHDITIQAENCGSNAALLRATVVSVND